MHFLNEQLAKEFLNRINYFRLKYFWIDMLDMESRDFKKDIGSVEKRWGNFLN